MSKKRPKVQLLDEQLEWLEENKKKTGESYASTVRRALNKLKNEEAKD